MNETFRYFDVSLCAWVIMPTHVHAVLGFSAIEHLSELMQSLKSLAARRIIPVVQEEAFKSLAGGRERTLWRPRFDDLIVWSEEQFRIKTEYIHNNPVKAGLVRRSTDYEYSSARDWYLDQPGLVEVDKAWAWPTVRQD